MLRRLKPSHKEVNLKNLSTEGKRESLIFLFIIESRRINFFPGSIQAWSLRGWDGWMATLTQWTWVWVDSGCWWWTGMPGVLWFMGSQRVRHAWAPELNCTFLPLKHSVLRTRESKSVKRQWFREELCLWVIFFILQFTKDGMISVQCLAAIVFTAVQFHFPWPLYR